MPIPGSDKVSVRASLSGTMRTEASAGSARSDWGQGGEAATVDRVGRVGDQFAQENLTVGIQRVDHEVEQTPHLGAEFMPFDRLAHASTP